MRSPAKQPFNVGDYVTCDCRIDPFLSDETLEVVELLNLGSRAKPRWRARCTAVDRHARGWLDADTLILVAAWPRTVGDVV